MTHDCTIVQVVINGYELNPGRVNRPRGFTGVLVSQGYYKYHRLSGLNHRILLLLVLEAEKSKIRVLADLVPVSLAWRQLQPWCVLTWQRKRECL